MKKDGDVKRENCDVWTKSYLQIERLTYSDLCQGSLYLYMFTIWTSVFCLGQKGKTHSWTRLSRVRRPGL